MTDQTENDTSLYVTTAIPYVNGDPHLGHALEFVQADVLARHARLRCRATRFLSGTDDNALKNVLAAEAAGVAVADFVAERAGLFKGLREPLSLSFDDFIETSRDPRHRPGVEKLWRACKERGDLYLRDYEGLYCAGCEAFLDEADLQGGLCPEHLVAPEPVQERNWFFRLSRYQDELLALVESGRLRVEPEHRKNEVLGAIRQGLEDFSCSRVAARAHGWGIPVPDDPSQVVYVWFDALANYVTALGYGRDAAAYRQWWGAGERLHVIGKGILRFHALYWPAILLSAGEPLPTKIFVHDYLTVEGEKIAKSRGNAVDPQALVARYGSDALRWWFLRDVPRKGDADFREEQLKARANELADVVGNLFSRLIALAAKSRPEGLRPSPLELEEAEELTSLAVNLPTIIDRALVACDLRAAADALFALAQAANRFVNETRPWELAKVEDEATQAQLDTVLAVVSAACAVLATESEPFLPEASARLQEALTAWEPALARSLFPKFALATEESEETAETAEIAGA